MSESAPALEANGLGKRYGRGRPALDGIDLAVRRGGLTALVGPNGAGKSTLMKAWVGLERPSAGKVHVCGIDPWRDRPGAIRRLAYVPQSPTLYRGLTVAEHLAYAEALRPGFDRPLAERRLDDLGVPLGQRAGTLSGGQMAQTGLALALGTRAPVLVLDEPLASLDPLARRDFLHVLGEAVATGDVTGVLSSHVVSDIEQACDRLVVLGAGRLVLDASLADALRGHVVTEGLPPSAPGGGHVASFLGARREALDLWRLSAGEGADPAGPRAATLEEVVMGYLAASRREQAAS